MKRVTQSKDNKLQITSFNKFQIFQMSNHKFHQVSKLQSTEVKSFTKYPNITSFDKIFSSPESFYEDGPHKSKQGYLEFFLIFQQ